MNIFSSIRNFITKKRAIYGGVILIIIVIILVSLSGSNGKERVAAIRSSIIQEVAATGKIKPNQNVDMGFDKSGRVVNVYAKVGDLVKQGAVIATLDSEEVSADLAKARASLLEENIKLREVENTAPISYNDALKNLVAYVDKGFAAADDAVRNKADQFFKTPSDNPRFEISFTDGNFIHYFNVSSDKAAEVNSLRKKIEIILDDWLDKTLNSSTQTLIVSDANMSIDNLNQISGFLDKMAAIVNSFSTNEYGYESTVTSYKTTISGARTEVSTALSDIVTAKDKLNTAPTLGESGNFESVLSQEAKVKQAEASVQSLVAALNKSSITAPFEGVVTVQDAKVGEAVTAGTSLISISSKEEMYIEANISEIHIGKVAAGNPVTITLDAFPGEEFSGEVSYVEPGDLIIDGVVNYKIRVALSGPDSRIKSGLTANLGVQTARKDDVLAVPLYSIIKEGDQNFVNKIVGEKVEKTPITLGLSGSNGLVEVLSGLEEGDQVEF